jgi:hypothetical protein
MKALIASVLLIISFSSQAQINSGNELYGQYKELKKETSVDWIQVGIYMGRVNGVLDTLDSANMICPPTGFA